MRFPVSVIVAKVTVLLCSHLVSSDWVAISVTVLVVLAVERDGYLLVVIHTSRMRHRYRHVTHLG